MLAKNHSFICALRMDLDPDTNSIDLISQDIGRVLQNVFNNAFYAVHEKRNQQNGTATVYEPQVFVKTYPLAATRWFEGGN